MLCPRKKVNQKEEEGERLVDSIDEDEKEGLLIPILTTRGELDIFEQLGVEKAKVYNFEVWNSYITYCKKLAMECKVSMRVLDRTL